MKMPKDFMDYPIIEVKGIHYIEVPNWKDAKVLVDLWNTDGKYSKIARAQFPEKKMDYTNNIPFDGFKMDYYYIHLLPNFWNTNN
jgi:hypothetical protein